jgi:hypothetical protein
MAQRMAQSSTNEVCHRAKKKPADPAHDNFPGSADARLSNRKNRAPVLKGTFNVAHPFAAASVFIRVISKKNVGLVRPGKMIFHGHSAAYAADH